MRPENILETCDRNGIIHSGNGAIYKSFKSAVMSIGEGFRVGGIPAESLSSIEAPKKNEL